MKGAKIGNLGGLSQSTLAMKLQEKPELGASA